LELDQGCTFCEHQFTFGRRYLIFVGTTDMPGMGVARDERMARAGHIVMTPSGDDPVVMDPSL
jgi:hypothetical protein